MTPSPTLRVLLVDDHPIVRSGLRVIATLDPRLQIAGEAGTVTEALAAIPALQPDVLLLDLRLPDGSGVELCRHARRLRPELRIICLTSFSDASLVLAALAAGADAYLLKHSDAGHIVDAIDAACRGEQVIDPGTSPNESSTHAGPSGRLTPSERRVLEQVVRGLTDKEVAQVLNLSSKTVRNCLDRAFAKLGVHSRTQAALAFSGLWAPDPPNNQRAGT
jgi:DNA-binding NarL/FixJ family response regulator